MAVLDLDKVMRYDALRRLKVNSSIGSNYMRETESVIHGYIVMMWGAGNLDLVDSYVHEDYVADGKKVGREFVRRNLRRFRASFPDHTVEILSIVVDGDQGAAPVQHSGTHLRRVRWNGGNRPRNEHAGERVLSRTTWSNHFCNMGI